MTSHRSDIDAIAFNANKDPSERLTVAIEAERRAHVAKWIARVQKSGAATLGTAMLFLPVVAGAQTAGDGLVNAAGIDGVRDVQLLDDGSARFTLDNGRLLNVSAADVVVGPSGEVQVSAQVAEILAEAAAAPAAAGGAAGAVVAGAAAGVAGIAAASGGGDDGGDGGSDPAPVVLNASDVASSKSLADIFGRNPDPEADRVTVTIGSGEGAEEVEATQDGEGNWSLPSDFTTQQGEQPISFTAERDAVDENGDPVLDEESGEQVVEEVGSGSATVLVDTIAPEIAIDTPIAGDDVLNLAEQGAGFDISGTTDAEDGQEVTVTLSGAAGTPMTATATVQGGAWTVSFTPAQAADLDGWDTVNVEATVKDAAGNPAQPSTATFDTDFDAPTITIDDMSDDNQIDLGDIQNGLEISGTTNAEDGQVVSVTFNGETYTATVATGAWSVSVPAEDLDTLDTGDTPEIIATVSDAAGNPATPATRPLTVDLTGPGLTIDPIAGDNTINAAESAENVTISGTTSNVGAGQDVTVTVNGIDLPVVQTQGDGTWAVTLPAANAAGLGDGASVTVGASVEDANGLSASATAMLDTDFTAPQITIATPIVDDDVLNIAEQGAGFDITGTTDAGDGQEITVTLTGTVATSEVTATGTAQGGNWTVNFTPAQAQDLSGWPTVNVAASVEDAAGNEGQTTASFATDFDAPTLTVNDLAGLESGDELTAADLVDGQGDPLDSITINGTSDAVGQEVTVTIGSLSGTATVQNDESWSFDFDAEQLGNALSGEASATISASVEDEAGNPESATLDLNVDLSLPEITIDAPSDATVLGLEAFDDGLDVSGTTTGVPDGQQVTIEIVDSTDTVVATITAPVAGDAWSGSFDAADIAGLDDESSFTLNARVNDGDFPARCHRRYRAEHRFRAGTHRW